MKIPEQRKATIWLLRPPNFRYSGVIKEMDSDWIILHDEKTNSDIIFVRENIDRVELK